MEEKIYERQVTKETLSQRVIDEHQVDRHFTFNDLQELYNFTPDRLNDPEAPKRPTPAVPKVSVMLVTLLTTEYKGTLCSLVIVRIELLFALISIYLGYFHIQFRKYIVCY